MKSQRVGHEWATNTFTLIIWHSGKGKPLETVKRSVVSKDFVEQGGGRGINRGTQGIFRAMKILCLLCNTLNDAIINDTSHYILSKPTECITPRVKPNVKYGFGVIMMCRYRFINCNTVQTSNCPCPLVRDVDSRGRLHVHGGRGNPCVFLIFLWA